MLNPFSRNISKSMSAIAISTAGEVYAMNVTNFYLIYDIVMENLVNEKLKTSQV